MRIGGSESGHGFRFFLYGELGSYQGAESRVRGRSLLMVVLPLKQSAMAVTSHAY